MARLWIVAALAGGLWAQDKKDAVLPKQEPPPAEEQLPPEEDAGATKQVYTFNPVRSKRDVQVGDFYLKKGDFKAAVARYKEATLWNEGNADAWLRLGEAEEKRGTPKAAKAAYREVPGTGPGSEARPGRQKTP